LPISFLEESWKLTNKVDKEPVATMKEELATMKDTKLTRLILILEITIFQFLVKARKNCLKRKSMTIQ
jgi:hypothetical protein